MPDRHYLGIDPGYNGSFALLNSKGDLVSLQKMPICKGERKTMDIKGIKTLLSRISSENACISICVEKAQAMPKQGISSTFAYGRGYGVLLGILTCLCLPYVEVHPRKWFGVMCDKAKGVGKERAYSKAKEIFKEWDPQYSYQKEWADSLLLAEYCRVMNKEKPRTARVSN